MTKPVVQVKHLTKTYKLFNSHTDRIKETFHPFKKQYGSQFHALEDVSFEIAKGETFGIVGKNGSGKSTLLQIISGVLQPTSGEVEVVGRVTSLLELGVGFNPEFSGIDNIYLSGAILGFSKEEMDQKIDKILAFADIGDFIYQPVKTYSSGMGVRLAFSIYSVVDPEIFIVDEALAVGDAYFVHRCMLRFHEMQSQGKTIILVSHDASSIKRLCKRALWLNQGRVAMIGNSSDVVDHYIAHIFKQKIASPALPNQSCVIADGGQRKTSVMASETTIPNIDKRIGTQECTIVGVGLYDKDLAPLSVCNNKSTVLLRVTVVNNNLLHPHPLAIGYILRDFKGVDIASTNSELEGVHIAPLAQGESVTIRIKIDLPWIYPGSYSLSPSLSYIKDGEHIICDRILNAIVFEVTSSSEMFVFMRLNTEVIVEHPAN